MLACSTTLGLTELVTSIPGLSAVGAATILAETGDPTRFSSARALVKHAGLCPRDNASGTYQGKTAISGRGRPELRLAAWRAVFAALQHNPVLAARHAHLTGRADNPLTDTQARVAVAGQPAAPAARRDHHPHRLGPRRRRRPRPRRQHRRPPPPPERAPLTTGGASSHRRRDHDPATDHEQPRPSPTKPG